MTTHNTHHEESDVDTNVVEHASVLEPTDETEATAASTPVEAEEQTDTPSFERNASPEESQGSTSSDNGISESEAVQQEEKQEEIEDVSDATSKSVGSDTDEIKELSAETGPAFSYDINQFAESKEEEIRPFTAFIEEFRQAEARFNASIQESQSEAFVFLATPEVAPADEINRYKSLPTVAFEDTLVPISTEVSPTLQEESLTEVPGNREVESEEKVVEQAKTAEPETAKKAPAERAVSPLLRPATRIRLPRHARHQREEAVETPAPQPTEQKETAEQAASQAPAAKQEQPSAPAAEPETPRPARRYRFDRPSATANGTAGTQSAQKADTRLESTQAGSTSETTTRAAASVELQEAKQPVAQETPVVESPAAAPPPPAEHGRRRQGHDRQKEQTTPVAPPAAPVTTPVAETQTAAQPAEIAPEDLPPLEYSELQKATSRRRRRHRTSASGTTTANGSAPTETPSPASPAAPVPPARPVNVPTPAAVVPPFTIVSGQTVNQMNQGGEVTGPFLGPEPSPARGSTPSRDGRTTRVELQRSAGYPLPTTRTHESPSTAAMHQLANIVSQSIQAQTDRMIAELRRANQAPTNVSVSLPPFPSTERVGVFVDVANLLYSARTLRLTVDFGKLLDFLRGNRRLVRAHAYCPTSPQPGEEQMFLQAVKGLGYRITTKNYKTFSSGAKKADLDLDLCMDVVRLVEGRSVDCIVLVSGDSDFMPMLDYCSDHGVRVEVAAFDEAASSTIRQSCDLFINLSMLEEIRS